jgi:hypothetical protein
MAVNVTFDLEVPEKYRSDYADAGRMNRHYPGEPICLRHQVSIISRHEVPII